MNDKDLCDALVADGLLYGTGELHTNPVHPYAFGKKKNGYAIEYYKHASLVLEDWRVAGACLERMSQLFYQQCHDCFYIGEFEDSAKYIEGENLPRAIIEAYCKARR